MRKAILTAINYKRNQHLALDFERDEELQRLLKSHFPALRWSQTYKVWHVPFSAHFKKEVFSILQGKAWLDYSSLQAKENTTKPITTSSNRNGSALSKS